MVDIDEETRTFIILRYNLMSRNDLTWPAQETYPKEVIKNWLMRCHADIKGLDVMKGLPKEWVRRNPTSYSSPAFYAAKCAHTHGRVKSQEKWDLYISWLIEELYRYEINKG